MSESYGVFCKKRPDFDNILYIEAHTYPHSCIHTSVLYALAGVAWSFLCVWTSRILGTTTNQSKSAEMDRSAASLECAVYMYKYIYDRSSIVSIYSLVYLMCGYRDGMCRAVLLDSVYSTTTMLLYTSFNAYVITSIKGW